PTRPFTRALGVLASAARSTTAATPPPRLRAGSRTGLSGLALARLRALAVALLALAVLVPAAHAVRIKELAGVQGVRSNQLTGYGLVVGLDGTGDQTTQMPYTTQSVANY